MKKVVLDTQRRQVLRAEEVEQDGDHYILLMNGRKRMVPIEKVAYIEDAGSSVSVQPPSKKADVAQHSMPTPILGNIPPSIPLPTAFSNAVKNNLKSAPPPEPVEIKIPEDHTHQIIVELAGSTSGQYTVLTDSESFASEHVRETLVSSIFSNKDLKEQLKGHNVVGMTKKGNLVTLECRNKPPVQQASVNAAMTSLVNNIVGLVSPATKLPDIPTQGFNFEDNKK